MGGFEGSPWFSILMLLLAANTMVTAIVWGALFLALATVFVWWWRAPLTIGQTFLWLINFLIAKLIWGTQVDKELPVGPGKGAVIVANHRSSVDPSFIQTCIRRVVYWMVAREYCEVAVSRLAVAKVSSDSRGTRRGRYRGDEAGDPLGAGRRACWNVSRGADQ